MKHAEDSHGGCDGVQQSQVSSSEPRPSILANNVIGPLLLEALDGFLFMVSCTGEVEFVSENVTNYLRYLQNDLIGKSIYSIIHPDDQLAFSNRLAPLIELSRATNSDRPTSRSISFTCRLQVKPNESTPEVGSVVRPQLPYYETLQILALLQPYPYDREGREGSQQESGNQYFLACIARRSSVTERTPIVHDIAQFLTKQDLKGKILACDTSRFSTDQLSLSAFIGHNIKDFCHLNDVSQLDRHHNEVLRIGSNLSGVYRMQLAPGHYVFVQTKSKLFKNSANGQPEFIMSTHSIVRKCDKDSELNGSASNSLMKALIGKSLPLGKSRENTTKSLDQKAQHMMNMYDNSSSGLMHNQGNNNRGGCNTVNDMDIDRLSSVGDVSDVSEINDLLEILHRHDASSSVGGGNTLSFDFMSGGSYGGVDNVTPLIEEVLRQSPESGDRRLGGGPMSRAGVMMPNPDYGDGQSGNGNNQTSLFNDSGLSEDDVTTLLFNFLPQQQQHLQNQQQVHHYQPTQRHTDQHPSYRLHSGSTPVINQQQRIPLLRRRNQGGAVGVSSPISSLRDTVASPASMLNSPFANSSPNRPSDMLSSPASANCSWSMPSPMPNDTSSSASLMGEIRRLKFSSTSHLNSSSFLRSPDAVFATPVTTPHSASASVGLKDLLLSNDEEDCEVSANLDGTGPRSADVQVGKTPLSGLVFNNRGFSFPSADGVTLDSRRRHASLSDRPDSSTKSSKPNVLLMKLLSGHDETDNEGESGNATKNDSNLGFMSSTKPTSSVASAIDVDEAQDESSSAGYFTENRRGSTDSVSQRNNNLLRQLLNEEKDDNQTPLSPRPLKLLEKLMNSEVSPVMEKPSSLTQHLSGGPSRSPIDEKPSTKDRYRFTAEDNDKLKQLSMMWDSSSDGSSKMPKTGVKRKAPVVMETPADSTDDSVATSSTSSSGERNASGSRGRKQPRKDILLTRLLSTSHTGGSEPTLNAHAISAIAVGTPQMNLVRRSTSDFFTSSGSAISSSSRMAPGVKSPMSRSSGGPLVGNSSSDRDSRHGLASSLLNGEANLQFINTCDMETDDDLTNMLHSIAPMENDGGGGSCEENALLSQLERILSSPSIALSELDSFLDDGNIRATCSSSSTRAPALSGLLSDFDGQSTPRDILRSPTIKESCQLERQSNTNYQQPTKPVKRSGTGLLQQLLGGHDDLGGSGGSSNQFSTRFSGGDTESIASMVSTVNATPSRENLRMATSSNTLSGTSTTADNVAALIQQAAAQAASRNTRIADRHGFQSRQNFTDPREQGATGFNPLSNLSDLLNGTIPPNVIAPVSGRNPRMPVTTTYSSTSSSSSRAIGNMSMQNVVMTTAASNKQRDIFARQTMNTAIMAGGAIVQNAGIEVSNSLSFSMSSPLFSTDLKSPQSSRSRDLQSPLGSLSHLAMRTSSSPVFNGSPHPGSTSYMLQSSLGPLDTKVDKFLMDRHSNFGAFQQPGLASGNRIAMQPGNISMTRRGSCSAEVMQGLRAKCSARSHSSQQRLVSDSSAGSASETSELPPDILQSLSELTEEHIEYMPNNASEESMSARQGEMNGSLEELLAGFCEDMGDNNAMFAQLSNSQAMMEHTEMKQESIGIGEMSGACPPEPGGQANSINHPSVTMGWSQHAPVDSQMQMRVSNKRGGHHQQFHQQQQIRMQSPRFDQQRIDADQQFSLGGIAHLQNVVDKSGSPGVLHGHAPLLRQDSSSAQFRQQAMGIAAQQPTHMGMVNSPHHQQPQIQDVSMHSQPNMMMSGSSSSNPHRSLSHRNALSQPQSSGMMLTPNNQMMSANSDGRMGYMRTLQQPPSSQRGSVSGGMSTMGQQHQLREAMHGGHGMGGMLPARDGLGPTAASSHKMPMMHANNEMGMMQRLAGGSTGLMQGGNALQHQSAMLHGETQILNSASMMQSSQFKPMMANQHAPAVNQSSRSLSHDHMGSMHQQQHMHQHQPGVLQHSRSSAPLRCQSDMMLSRMNNNNNNNMASSPNMTKNFATLPLPNQHEMMQSGQMGASLHRVPPKHHQQHFKDMSGGQQMVQETPDMDMFNWLVSDQGMSADMLSTDGSSMRNAPVQGSQPNQSAGGFQSTFGGERYLPSGGQQNIATRPDMAMPVGNSSSLDFLTNPTSFLSRVHEDGFSSRQQMLEIAMAPDSNEGKSSRQANANIYRRQSSSALHNGPGNVTAGETSTNNMRFHSGMMRESTGGVRSMAAEVHAGNTRTINDMPMDPGLTHPGAELSNRRMQRVSNAGGSMVANNYQTTADMVESGNDSFMNHLFGTTASPLMLSVQNSDAMNSCGSMSRLHQSGENISLNSDIASFNNVMAPVSMSDDNRRAMEARHCSNGSLLQQLLSD